VTTPHPPKRPAGRTDASWPPSSGPSWPALPNWPGYNVPVNPDEASVIVRIRQPPFSLGSWDRASIQVDGQEVFVEWQKGIIAIGVPPGYHHLRVWKPRFPNRPFRNNSGLLIPSGAAEFVITVVPRQMVELEYAPSLWYGIDGSLGYPPQPLRGLAPAAIAATLWWILGVTLFVLVALHP
jgi:hypothetical protein